MKFQFEPVSFISLINSSCQDTKLESTPNSVKKKLVGCEAVEIVYSGITRKHVLIFLSFKQKQGWVTAFRKIQEKEKYEE